MHRARRAITGLLLAAAFIATACAGPLDRADAIQGQFPLIEQTQLRGFRNDEQCHTVSYAGHTYSTFSSDCSTDGWPTPNRLDEASRATFSTMEAAFKSTGLTMTFVSIENNPDGTVGPGSYFVDGDCYVYVYDPGWTELPQPPSVEPGAATAINANWYLVDSCA